MTRLLEEAYKTTTEELPKLFRKVSGVMSDGRTDAHVLVGYFKLCNLVNFGDIYAKCNLNYFSKEGLKGVVLLDSEAGVSLGLVKFEGNVAEMYNNGMQKGVLFLNFDMYSASEVVLPGRVRVPSYDLETLDVPEDLIIMTGLSLGAKSTVRL